ncbi:uncharacterized protein [Miscanthus floridulus]|uniref:uncharacterized protein isoform X1 n=1 Tax=Miscanthus floridulus TaxID=154761 RepID=UPI003459B807
MLLPHPSPLAPRRASSSSPAARLRFRLPFLCYPYPSPSPRSRWPPPIRAHASGEPGLGGRRGVFGPDVLLSAAELLCLAPPAICSVVCAARLVFLPAGSSAVPPPLVVLQYVLLVGAVAIGSLIRRRQSGRLRPGLTGRVEKVEETVRGMVAAVAVLSRTVEKLGLRFRVLRRTLRDPITELSCWRSCAAKCVRINCSGGNMKAWLFLLCICIVVNNTSSYASSLWRRQVYIRMTPMFAFSISSAVLSLHKLLWKKEHLFEITPIICFSHTS